MSGWFNSMSGSFERKFRGRGLQLLNVKQGETILEIGFGTGYGILALAKSAGETGKVYGLDISEKMCRITNTKINKSGLSESVELICADAIVLPYKNYFFDAIFMSFSLELFDTPEIPVVLNECQRVLRNNGRICIVAMSKKEKNSLMSRLYEWSHKKFPKYIDCRPIFVSKALEDSGFHITEETEISSWGLPVVVVVAKK